MDTDVLCLLARRLLATNPSIRLVLMSATLSSGLYQTYFSVKEEAIFVGARRFPVNEIFLDELQRGPVAVECAAGGRRMLKLPQKQMQQAAALKQSCDKPGAVGQLTQKQHGEQWDLTVALTRCLACEGGALLVFVSGLSDINELAARFEELHSELEYQVSRAEQLAVSQSVAGRALARRTAGAAGGATAG